MRRPASPTVDLLAAFALVSTAGWLAGLVGLEGLFVLAAPVSTGPRALVAVVASVYAHASPGHLAANAVALVLVGFALERSTTRLRFHALFLAIGIAAGLTQVLVGARLGGPTAVIGASGAVLGLYGYALAGNPLTGGLLERLDLSRRARLFALAAAAAAVVVLTAGPGVALVAHATGFALGAVAGRVHLLRAG